VVFQGNRFDAELGLRLSEREADILLGLYVSSVVTGAAFLGMAIVGIVEALVSYEPTRVVRREREIPPQIQRRIDLQLGLGSLRVRF
jgi:hypothetical protein